MTGATSPPRIAASGIRVMPDTSGRPAPHAKPILDGAAIDIRSGEVHALVGPNGAGKSTLFGVLAGDVAPTAGDVILDGTHLRDHRPRDLARRRAVLLQQNAVSFPFSVAEVVRMGRAPWARTPLEAEDDARVAEAMRATDIDDLADRTVTSLSGGERARVALARVLAQATGILLLDEPTAALDLKHQEDVLRVVRERARADDAVAIVLHDLNAAIANADRVTLLDGGRVVATGTPPEVLTAKRIGAVYRQAVDVFPHPVTGVPLVVPRR